MTDRCTRDIASHYYVDDVSSALLIGTRLQGVLACLWEQRPVTSRSLAFLSEQGFDALYRLASGSLGYEEFREAAQFERAGRLARRAPEIPGLEDVAKQERLAAMRALSDETFRRMEAERKVRESDPKYIARAKNRALHERYGIEGYVGEEHFGPLMSILRTVDAGRRLGEVDYAWLCSEGDEYFTEELRMAYHHLEATALADEFREKGDCWLAVNASSHFRKAGESGRADQLLGGIKLADNAPRKLRSALCTTHGGVMRDLGHWDDALRLGQDAHALTPKDYRPCTLLGAVYMETSRYDLGQLWYAKAVERGANERDVDNDLRNIYQRANRDKKAALSAFLIRSDPQRYAWARLPK